MNDQTTYSGFSSITFDELGLRAHVSRSRRTAGVFDLMTQKTIGVLIRRPEGRIDWQSLPEIGQSEVPCPIEIFDVVCTMI